MITSASIQREATELFDFLNGATSDSNVNKEALAAHLELCFSCQETVVRLKNIDKALLQEILVP